MAKLINTNIGNNRRGFSEVVTTSLLIMISVALAAVIFIYIINYSNKPFSLSPNECINFQSAPPISIESTCYNELTEKVEVRLRRGIDNLNINSLKIAVSSKSDTQILQCSQCGTCTILDSGEQRLYYINYIDSEEKPESISMIIDECEIGIAKKVEKC